MVADREPEPVRPGAPVVTWRAALLSTSVPLAELHALAYNLANFLRTLALPREIAE
jgi:hypothetical protein